MSGSTPWNSSWSWEVTCCGRPRSLEANTALGWMPTWPSGWDLPTNPLLILYGQSARPSWSSPEGLKRTSPLRFKKKKYTLSVPSFMVDDRDADKHDTSPLLELTTYFGRQLINRLFWYNVVNVVSGCGEGRGKTEGGVPNPTWWSGNGYWGRGGGVWEAEPRECSPHAKSVCDKREGGKQCQTLQMSSKMDLKKVHWIRQIERDHCNCWRGNLSGAGSHTVVLRN